MTIEASDRPNVLKYIITKRDFETNLPGRTLYEGRPVVSMNYDGVNYTIYTCSIYYNYKTCDMCSKRSNCPMFMIFNNQFPTKTRTMVPIPSSREEKQRY